MSNSNPGTAPRARKRAESQNSPAERRNRDLEVIDVATAVMSQRGYAATSIQEIADRVGVLKGSLYHYFASKEDLLFRVISESQAESDQITKEVAALGLEPIDELSEFLRRLCMWFLTHVDRANIFFAEGRHLTGAHGSTARKRARRFVDHIQGLIAAAQAEGQIKSNIDEILLTQYVLGALNNVRAWPATAAKSFTREQMADAFVHLTRNALESAGDPSSADM
jgi:TetR/AcrR family transcriptional regulator, cholesterol catabolism regulator